MKTFDFFKRKKKKEPETQKSVREKKTAPAVQKKDVQKKELEKSKPSKKIKSPKEREHSKAFKILKEPHISEKSTKLSEKNAYIFKVYPDTNKKQIKKAIEDVYRVNVVSVNIINIPSKKRRLRRVEGVRKGYKKAVVRIKEGQKIELL